MMMNAPFWIEVVRLLGPIVLVVGLYEILCVVPLRLRAARLARTVAALEGGQTRTEALKRKLGGLEADASRDIAQLTRRIDQLELRGESRAYEQAIHLAANGGEADRLVQYFGLTQGEAELVRLLHGKQAAAGAKSRSGTQAR
jgi:hypothetical protein